ncbi:hypothetical protein BJ742DRAFT_835854 [Cladochytrium replicatum]|nr:hypothetical protein BJ742DRAFT_835854 [Cladochytrium replicatum]
MVVLAQVFVFAALVSACRAQINWQTGNWAYNCDWTGNDLTSAASAAADCGPKCQALADCTHFTWNDFNGGTCWMKQGTVTRDQAIAASGTVCGYVEKIRWQSGGWGYDCDFTGKDLSGPVTPSAADCGPKCASTPGCTHFSWTTFNGGTCWMKQGGASQSDAFFSAGAICGIVSGGSGGGSGGGGSTPPNDGPTDGNRRFTLINKCSSKVYFKFESGAAAKNGNAGCNSNADCINGAYCLKPPNLCFWNIPKPTNGRFSLNAGETSYVTFPYIDNGSPIVWSGNVGGCAEGTCPKSASDCDANGCSTAGQGPVTMAEWTLQKTTIDYYDISIINGLNIPIEMRALGQAGNRYNCGAAGGRSASPGLSNCDSNYSPPYTENNWVLPGGRACGSSSECGNGDVCGVSFNAGQSPLLKKTCGKRQGYWSANQICGIQRSFGGPFNCQSNFPYLACAENVSQSCYQNGAGSGCCGCVAWESQGVSAPSTEQCKNSNPTWTANALPQLTWMKKGCPTAYTYPYDDMSSTFTCAATLNGKNTQNYQITFCP